MKIKTWLLLSYFIVMILPLVAIYFLFASVTAYYDDKQVEEYLYVYEQIQTIIPYLEDPKLYEANENKENLLQLIDEQVNISLYNSDGLLIFNSNNDIVYSQSIDFLFQDLYE